MMRLLRDGIADLADRLAYGATPLLGYAAIFVAAGVALALGGALYASKTAHAVDATLPGGWSLYGQALQEDGKTGEAKTAFQRALQSDPNDFDALLHLGALLRHEGSFAEAAPYLERALELRPASIPARYQVGALNLALGNLDIARKDLERVERDSPEFQEVHVQLAALHARLHLTADSQRERELVLKLNEKARALGPQPNE